MFVYLFGGALKGNTHDYLQVLLPGLMVQNIAFASMGTGYSLNTDITKGVFDRFRSMPIARSAPLVGAVLGDIVRYLVAMAVLLVTFAVILGFRVHTDPVSFLIAVALMVVFGLCLCWVSVLVGMLVKSPQAVPGTLVAFMMPLTFGSNVFVDPSTMPGWLAGLGARQPGHPAHRRRARSAAGRRVGRARRLRVPVGGRHRGGVLPAGPARLQAARRLSFPVARHLGGGPPSVSTPRSSAIASSRASAAPAS